MGLRGLSGLWLAQAECRSVCLNCRVGNGLGDCIYSLQRQCGSRGNARSKHGHLVMMHIKKLHFHQKKQKKQKKNDTSYHEK